MGMFKEFKDFAMRGNVVDMAIGVVIGGAFGAIVNSLVGDIFTPLLGVVTQRTDFGKLAYEVVNPLDGKVLASVAYGKFLNTLINFIVVAFCLFLVVKAMNAMVRKQVQTPPPPAPPTKDQELLAEIRDLLKNR